MSCGRPRGSPLRPHPPDTQSSTTRRRPRSSAHGIDAPRTASASNWAFPASLRAGAAGAEPRPGVALAAKTAAYAPPRGARRAACPSSVPEDMSEVTSMSSAHCRCWPGWNVDRKTCRCAGSNRRAVVEERREPARPAHPLTHSPKWRATDAWREMVQVPSLGTGIFPNDDMPRGTLASVRRQARLGREGR